MSMPAVSVVVRRPGHRGRLAGIPRPARRLSVVRDTPAVITALPDVEPVGWPRRIAVGELVAERIDDSNLWGVRYHGELVAGISNCAAPEDVAPGGVVWGGWWAPRSESTITTGSSLREVLMLLESTRIARAAS